MTEFESAANYEAMLRRVAARARGIAVPPPRPKNADLLAGWPLDDWISTTTIVAKVRIPEATVFDRLQKGVKAKRVQTRKEGKRRLWKWAEKP